MARAGRVLPIKPHLGHPIVTPAAGVPFAPTGLTTVQLGSGQLGLTWSAPGNNGSAITDYVIQYRPKAINDQFSGTGLDPNNWMAYNRLMDQANSEVGAMIPPNARVSGGSLFIDSKFEDVFIGDSLTPPTTVHYTSAQVAQPFMHFLYGRVDVRAKICAGAGTWPVLWMLDYTEQTHQPGSADDPGSPGWNPYAEIDFAEWYNGSRTTVNCQIHYNPGTGQVDPGGIVSIPGGYDVTTRFMVYRLDWSAGSAIFSIDPEDGSGFNVVQTITGAGNVPNVPMFVMMSTAIGGLPGAPVSTDYPTSMEIDYVQITPIWNTFSDGTSTATSTTVTGLENGFAYEFQVAAVNGVGQGPFSSTASDIPGVMLRKQPPILNAVRRAVSR